MKELIELVSAEIMNAFEKAGYDNKLGKVAVSKRPDLCEYQCSGAMGGAKLYHKAPLVIAGEVVKELDNSSVVENVTAAAPGFINCNVKKSFLCDYVTKMANDEKFGLARPEKSKTIIVDYGGPNVAKPLHVGHLRSAVIGESIKRICRYMGHKTIGDIHLGDWGLQMGLIIYELSLRKPDLPYFDDSFTGEYPKEAPFTISELEKLLQKMNKFEHMKIEDKSSNEREKIFFDGISNLLESNATNVEAVIDRAKLLNRPDYLKSIFVKLIETDKYKNEEVYIVFGEDFNVRELEDFSFVFSIYTVEGSKGIIGVIGPKRMEYSKTVGLVNHVSAEVKKMMKKIE